MTVFWGKVFDDYAIKTVTKTDKNKGAYLPNVGQRRVLELAGVLPSNTRPASEFVVTVLNDIAPSVGASFYYFY